MVFSLSIQQGDSRGPRMCETLGQFFLSMKTGGCAWLYWSWCSSKPRSKIVRTLLISSNPKSTKMIHKSKMFLLFYYRKPYNIILKPFPNLATFRLKPPWHRSMSNDTFYVRGRTEIWVWVWRSLERWVREEVYKVELLWTGWFAMALEIIIVWWTMAIIDLAWFFRPG